jgi:subtilisin family serine protease
MTDSRSLDPQIRRLLRSQPEAASKKQRVLVELATDSIPQEFAHLEWHRIVDSIYLLNMPLADAGRLAAHTNVVFIEVGHRIDPTLDKSCEYVKARALHTAHDGVPGCDGTGVVVGVIDWGLDYILDDFRDEKGESRVAYLWDPSLTPQRGERSPAEFGFGVEYDRVAINRALKSNDPFSIVRHKPEEESHGTHVTGIAAGNGRSHDSQYISGTHVGVAPGATIIFVQNHEVRVEPGLVLEPDDLMFSVTVWCATAISYIFQKARQLGMPCVINASLTTQTGSRDGESVLEHILDRLLMQRGRALVATAGNVGHLGGHASGTLRTGETRRVGLWHYKDVERGVEIWHRSRDRFKVRVINPAGVATPWVEANQQLDKFEDGSSNRVSIDSELFTALNGDALIFVDIIPEAPGKKSDTDEPLGKWAIELQATDTRDGRFDAYVVNVRNVAMYFAPDDMDKSMVLAAPGTSFNCITVANYDVANNEIEASSGRGPTRDGRLKPDLAAPGMNIYSSCSLAGQQRTDGSMVPARTYGSGTSQAAPHVAGAVALLLQKAPKLSSAQIRELLIAGATPLPDVAGYRNDCGHGILNVERTLALVEELQASDRMPSIEKKRGRMRRFLARLAGRKT